MKQIFWAGTAKGNFLDGMMMPYTSVIGTEIGNHIYYENYCCEITDKNDKQYQLIACGWVDKDKCRLIE